MEFHGDWIHDVMIFLVASGIVVPLFQRARLGLAIGFLLAGIIVGPYGLGRLADAYPFLDYATFADPEEVTGIAELGIVFLLFMLGLETSFDKLWTLRKYVLGAGSLQVVVSALLIGGVAALFANSADVSVVVGLAFALSSTAIVMQLLYESHRVATPVGRMALAILLMQDLMVIPILFVVGLLGAGITGNPGIALLEALGLAAVTVAVIMVAGRYALRPLLRMTAQTGSRDLFVAFVLLIMGAIALLTSAAGLSLALGAFLAGLLLSESEYRHQIEVDIEPFRGLLLGLFFMTVGMGIDPLAVVDNIFWLLASAAGLIVLKAAVLFAIFTVFRVERPTAVETALLLGQAGEFVFVVLQLGRSGGVVDAGTAQFFILVASLSMLVTPLLARFASRAGAWVRSEPKVPDDMRADHADLEGHVIIGGFGRVGRIVARILEMENVPYVALDRDSGAVQVGRREGHNLYFGDASRSDILKRVSCENARAFIVTLDEPKAAERMVANARRLAPGAMVFARAKDIEHARRLDAIGVDWVVPEAVEGSLRLADKLMEGLGYPHEAAMKLIDTVREDEERLH
ncbi:cation:proton antiporter [Tepidamorphus sp. 3E244]|uniref:cation:proton antiporter domain-containing protein n=1 Tax=Tepidamorphus sp. 3E244 TaxID=3385498 RepID=UPI0038FC958E